MLRGSRHSECRPESPKVRIGVMKKVVSVLALSLLLLNTPGVAEESAFNCKLADAKGKQAEARLILSDNASSLIVRVSDRDLVTIPYKDLDKFSYEYSKKHRVTQGAIVMVASLGAGAIVMLTKSKSHWLYIDFHEQAVPKSLVLRMDKKNYKQIMDSISSHTGKNVEFIGDAGKDKAKEKAQDKE